MTDPTTVTITGTYPDSDAPLANVLIDIELRAGTAGGTVDGQVVTGTTTVKLDASGQGSVDLYPNTAIDPPGSHYALAARTVTPSIIRRIQVPVGGPVDWSDEAIQVTDPTPPTVVPSPRSGSAFQVLRVDAEGSRYELADPEPGETASVQSPLRDWAWALSATENPSPRDITGHGLHAAWGTGEFDIRETRLTPADGPRLLHWQTEDEDPPDFLGASTAPVDWTSSDTWFISAKWRSIDPWHTGTYPQSLGFVQGGNGSGEDQKIEAALGISGAGRIRFTGYGLDNNDFGGLGQFNPAGGVEVAALVDQPGGTITAYQRLGGAWVQVGDPVVKPGPIVLVNDSFDDGIHKFATGYGKGWQSYAALATTVGGTPVRRFDAADAVAAEVAPGDTWTGTVDGQTWLLGAGVDDGRTRIPAIYATSRAGWALGAGSAWPTAATPDLGDQSWSMAVTWTPRSGGLDDTLIAQRTPGPSLRREDGEWLLVVAEPLADGTLLVEDSGAFGTDTDGAGSLDPVPVARIEPGGDVAIILVDPGDVPARDVTAVTDATGLTIVTAFLAGDFSAGVYAQFSTDGTVTLFDDVGATVIGTGVHISTPGDRVGIRVAGGEATATVNGIVVARGATTTPPTGYSGVTLIPGGSAVSSFRLREADTVDHPQISLGELENGTPHTLVVTVDQDATPDPVLRVRIDGTDLDGLPDPPADIGSDGGLLLAPAVHQDLHDIGIDLSVIPDIEIAAVESLT